MGLELELESELELELELGSWLYCGETVYDFNLGLRCVASSCVRERCEIKRAIVSASFLPWPKTGLVSLSNHNGTPFAGLPSCIFGSVINIRDINKQCSRSCRGVENMRGNWRFPRGCHER